MYSNAPVMCIAITPLPLNQESVPDATLLPSQALHCQQLQCPTRSCLPNIYVPILHYRERQRVMKTLR
jgi:hypothetical protein